MRHEIMTEKEVSARTEKELTGDLASTKHALLDIQHQLSLAEKVLLYDIFLKSATMHLKVNHEQTCSPHL